MARLPEIKLTCTKCGHVWPTTAKAGSSIRCPECRNTARVPAGRPATAAEAERARAGDIDPQSWPVVVGGWRDDLEDDAGEPCPSCGEPMQWTGAHSAIICPQCGAYDISPIARKAEADLARSRRRPARRAEPDAADPGDRGELADALGELDGLIAGYADLPRHGHDGQMRRIGARWAGMVDDWHSRTRQATTAAHLAQIAAEARDLRDSRELAAWLANVEPRPVRAGSAAVDRPAIVAGEMLAIEAADSDDDNDDGQDDEPRTRPRGSSRVLVFGLAAVGVLAAIALGGREPAGATGGPSSLLEAAQARGDRRWGG